MAKYNLEDRSWLPDDDILQEKMKEAGIPEYVTLEQEIGILNLIKAGMIHPVHKACDSSLEGMVGVDIGKSLYYHVERRDKEGSIHQRLYDLILDYK